MSGGVRTRDARLSRTLPAPTGHLVEVPVTAHPTDLLDLRRGALLTPTTVPAPSPEHSS